MHGKSAGVAERQASIKTFYISLYTSFKLEFSFLYQIPHNKKKRASLKMAKGTCIFVFLLSLKLIPSIFIHDMSCDEVYHGDVDPNKTTWYLTAWYNISKELLPPSFRWTMEGKSSTFEINVSCDELNMKWRIFDGRRFQLTIIRYMQNHTYLSQVLNSKSILAEFDSTKKSSYRCYERSGDTSYQVAINDDYGVHLVLSYMNSTMAQAVYLVFLHKNNYEVRERFNYNQWIVNEMPPSDFLSAEKNGFTTVTDCGAMDGIGMAIIGSLCLLAIGGTIIFVLAQYFSCE